MNNELLTIYMTYLYFFFNISISLLARNFGSAQGVCLPDTGLVLLYFEDIRSGKNNAVITRNSRQNKTKPFQSHSKPFFQRPNFNLSPKMRIFDKFRQTFLCKTKPFFSKIQIKNKGLTAVSQSTAGVYPAPTWLVRGSLKTE